MLLLWMLALVLSLLQLRGWEGGWVDAECAIEVEGILLALLLLLVLIQIQMQAPVTSSFCVCCCWWRCNTHKMNKIWMNEIPRSLNV